MRFDRLRIHAYGNLRELDTGEEPLPGVVVVHGPNEAGKSTFFDFLGTLLYGFYPASRDRNPYTPWSGEDAEGSASIRLDDGGEVQLRRRLLSSPSGTLVRDGVEEDLRNHSLPWATQVPRTVFEQVFALSLRELAELDADTWARVEDRLLGSMGSDLVPAREVAGRLEEEASSLWRPNRRGNQRIRQLREDLRALRTRRREAAARDQELRELQRRRDEARDRLAEARREREEARLRVERIDLLGPVRARLRRIAELEEIAAPREELDALPADPDADRDRLREAVGKRTDRLDELDARRQEPRAAVEELDDAHRALLQRRSEIARFTARAAGWSAARTRRESLLQEIRDRERRLEATAGPVLTLPWDEAPSGPLLSLSTEDLRRRARELDRARDRLATAEARAAATADATEQRRAHPRGRRTVLLLTGGAAAFAGVAGLALAVSLGSWAAALPAVLALVAGAGILHVWWHGLPDSDPRTDPARQEARDEVGRAAEEVEAAGESLRASVRDVPVALERLEVAPGEVATALERIQELLRDREERARTVRELEETLGAADREAAELASLLGRETELDAESLARLLERELHRAERLQDAARAGERELERIHEEAERLEAERRAREESLETLEGRLRALGDGDVEEGLDRARTRLEARASAERLQTELERANPDLDALVARIRAAEAAGESWVRDDDALVSARSEEDALTDEIEELTGTAERLEQELLRGLEEETVDVVDSEIATLEEEEERLVEERDRRWILAHLVREADRSFREEHQPDVLRRAGGYLSRLTHGRYTRLVADDGSGDHRFHLVGGDRRQHTPLAPPLSTGTLEQAYLALRLAILDHLDADRERLPLFVDEALVNWDPDRRGRGWDLLDEVGGSRQVFVFTCHPQMVEELTRRGAFSLPLERPPAPVP